MWSDREASVFVLSAPSGAGKTTVLGRVLGEVPGLRFSISHTTRTPRPGEVDGVAYHFTTRPEFLRMVEAKAFLEWAEVHGQFYGTSSGEVERAAADGLDLVLDIDVQGAMQVRARVRNAVTIVVLSPSYQALEARLRGRGPASETDLERRLQISTREASRMGEYDYVVVNDDLDGCVGEIEAIIRASRCRTAVRARGARRILGTFPSQQGVA
jgi:guanylate kinase